MATPIAERIFFIQPSVENQEFSYDFAPLAQEVREMRQRIKAATSTSFDYISAFFSALASASYGLIYSIIPSFSYSVLGLRRGIPATIEVLFFKTIVWAASLTLSFVLAVYSRFSQNLGRDLKENQETLMSLSKTLDSRHFKTKELALDTSNVPDNVTVESLLDMFDQINFDYRENPGYMAESSRQEGRTTYTSQNLRKNLQNFVKNVKNRVPFIGTPRSHDIIALMKFYQQIEDAVRLSIHKSNEDLRAFQARSGTNTNAYSTEALNEYRNILEDRSRLVIDLAIAGAHCGARFMGDSMSVYDNFYGGGTQTQATLEDTLIEILAHKRKQIVGGMVQEAAGDRGVDTHIYARHMALLGEILGLPGTKGVVEHLSARLNRTETLKKFFEHYTQETIIESINEKWQDVKNGSAFRDQIYDWLTNLRGDWNKQKYTTFLESKEIQEFRFRLESLKTREVDTTQEMHRLNLLLQLIKSIPPDSKVNVTVNDWDAFLVTLLAAEANEADPLFQAKKTFRDEIDKLARDRVPDNIASQIKMLTKIESRKIIDKMKTAFSSQTLGAELVSSLVSFNNGDSLQIDTDPFIEIFSKPKRHNEVLLLFRSLGDDQTSASASEASEAATALSSAHIEADSVSRFLDGSLPAKELLENTYEKTRKEEFIQKFQVYGDQNPTDYNYENLVRRERIQKITNGIHDVDEAGEPVFEDKITYEPLPPALLEVLLVSHKIFLPQSITNGGI